MPKDLFSCSSTLGALDRTVGDFLELVCVFPCFLAGFGPKHSLERRECPTDSYCSFGPAEALEWAVGGPGALYVYAVKGCYSNLISTQ